MTLPGNGRCVNGSTSVTPEALKSPARSAAVGTCASRVSASMPSMTSTLVKKNDGQLPDRAAQRAAELVLAQPRLRVVVGQQAVAGVQRRVAEVLVGAALQVARARLRTTMLTCAAGAAAVLGVVGVLEQRDLLDGVEARVDHEPVEEEVVVVDAVEQEVVGRPRGRRRLLRPTLPCVDSREPGAGGATPGAWCANWSASRSRTGSDASVSRSNTSPTALSPATSVVRSAVTSTCSSTVPASSTMLSVLLTDACRRTSRISSVLKPTRRGGHEIRAGGEERDDQGALGVGRAAPADAALAVGEHHGDVRHHRVAGVADLDGEGGGRRLRRDRRRQTGEEGREHGDEGTGPPRVEQSEEHTEDLLRRERVWRDPHRRLAQQFEEVDHFEPSGRRAGAGSGRRPDPR